MSDTCPFLQLPLELREEIYSYYFDPASRLSPGELGGVQYKFEFSLYRVSKQVYTEAQTVFRRRNVFVRIETPWSEAVKHIAHDNFVPIVAAANRDLFRYHHGLISINAPALDDLHAIIILVDDLHLFAQVWYYSALNWPNLNEHLRVTFVLQDPYYSADPKPIPIVLQKRLLLPFENVKGLYEVEVQGYDEGVKLELERRMAIPYDSVQACCERSTAFMESGDRAMAEGRPDQALQLYVKALHAIHIIVDGRTRRVLADNFFHSAIESGRYSGQTGITVRIILRIKLVSRTINAYLKRQQWEEAAFWGLRSIKIMREAMDTEFEDFLAQFVGAFDVGLIYLRTAVAFRKMEDSKSEELKQYKDEDVASSRELFPIAIKYLQGPHQRLIRKELDENHVELDRLPFIDDAASEVDSLAPMNQEDAESPYTCYLVSHYVLSTPNFSSLDKYLFHNIVENGMTFEGCPRGAHAIHHGSQDTVSECATRGFFLAYKEESASVLSLTSNSLYLPRLLTTTSQHSVQIEKKKSIAADSGLRHRVFKCSALFLVHIRPAKTQRREVSLLKELRKIGFRRAVTWGVRSEKAVSCVKLPPLIIWTGICQPRKQLQPIATSMLFIVRALNWEVGSHGPLRYVASPVQMFLAAFGPLEGQYNHQFLNPYFSPYFSAETKAIDLGLQ
ncbi:uncharacterized protein BDR25DRAFT_396286 [Lindgomyces ingoldianus]|uniref:Uncharacterized protein n=1 Tax=Lindgomyces ingoldianus TaxID=673940 RepID=A0ACB6QFZ7_9PLEO|nr:uncharacterized protein BDR25DRAFT_396286 [Lindgomyces ingoldianus]KAF2465282.1 hypothetical protein BDR25DRAFT_396286 [Lindgomyces ingoldianus]